MTFIIASLRQSNQDLIAAIMPRVDFNPKSSLITNFLSAQGTTPQGATQVIAFNDREARDSLASVFGRLSDGTEVQVATDFNKDSTQYPYQLRLNATGTTAAQGLEKLNDALDTISSKLGARGTQPRARL